ncbi:MAG: serine hydrolase [Phormidesmis sp.]
MIRLWSVAAIAATFGLGAGLITGLKVLPASTTGNEKSQQVNASSAPTKQPNSDSADSESTDLENYRRAIELSDKAIAAAQSAENADDNSRRLELIQQARASWQDALGKLAGIPKQSDLYERAVGKRIAYQQNLIAIEGKIAKANQTFLDDVIQDVGLDPAKLHITLCQLTSNSNSSLASVLANRAQLNESPPQLNPQLCREHQGDQLLASPASLIKLPIAVALMAKVSAEHLDLNDKIFVDPNNFTETGGSAMIEVGNTYSLRQVMAQMIKESDNIATNQLIDYLGYDYINQAISQSDYPQTVVGHKLMGDQTMPVDFGDGNNQSTTQEITAMMAQVYSLTDPAHKEILRALSSQQDREIGYEALEDLGPKVKWVGEKTGQNDRVIGSTLAMDISEERYILTVAIDYDSDLFSLRQIISKIATYLSKNGPLTTG